MKLFKTGFLFLVAIVILTGCIKQAETKEMNERNEKITKRVGGLINVRPEFEERYIILHKHTFPGVLESIKRSNIRNYSIFLLDGLLFSHYEYVGTNFEADMKSIGDETTKEWWKLTDPMQEPLPTRKEGEWWAGMDLLYNTDFKVKPYSEAKRFAMVAELVENSEENLRKEIKTVSADQIAVLEKLNFQNFNFYLKDGKLYLYFEYVGKDFEKDKNELNQNEAIGKYKSGLSKYLKSPWVMMKEVFHTN